jgi:methylase of polypeptide subunit release factors
MAIYEPQEDSFLLQKVLKEYAFGRVLDMGTGSGIQALTAMRFPNVR